MGLLERSKSAIELGSPLQEKERKEKEDRNRKIKKCYWTCFSFAEKGMKKKKKKNKKRQTSDLNQNKSCLRRATWGTALCHLLLSLLLKRRTPRKAVSQRRWGSDPAAVEKSLKRVGGAGVRKGESTCEENKSPRRSVISASQRNRAGDLPWCFLFCRSQSAFKR